jgi:polygalacturonase
VRSGFLRRSRAALIAVMTGALCVSAGMAQGASDADRKQHQDPMWRMVPKIVKSIDEPVIPDRDYQVTDFGAVGDGETDARPAIMAAIEQASEDGGGRIVLPSGTWLSNGPIHLESNIDLHVSEGAHLLFSPEPADYLPVVRTRWEGTEMYGYSPLIYAADVHDVAITGKGVIDGNENSEFHSWNDKQEPDQLALRQMGFDGVPLEQRQFGEGHFLRPSMIQFFGAERVLLDGYTVNNSPFWINHLVYTDDAVVRNLTVDSHYANNDGVDVDSSTNVLIEDNVFRTGDDSVVVKSGRDLDGRTIGRPSENVVVRNNDMGGEDGIALGSEMSGGIRYVFFTDNVLRSGASVIRFKGNLDRGGTVEHIRVRNMQVESFENLIWFQLNYPGELGGNFPPTYRDIVFSDFTVQSAETVFEAHAPEVQPLEDVTLRNIEVKEATTPMVLENVEDLTFDNVVINGDRIDGNLSWQ